MEILGIGPLEILFILVLVLIIFGPKELNKAGKTIGKSLNKLIRSDTWKTINQAAKEIKYLPNRLMREAGLEELEKAAKENPSPKENTIRTPSTSAATDNPPPPPAKKTSDSTDSPPIEPPKQVKPE